jgi:hypothetical protein
MAKTPWTYEVPPAGGETAGLEEYVVYDSRGEPVGKVTVVLRARDGLYLVVDRGSPPLTHDRRAVPWEKVGPVDHSALGLRLDCQASELDHALELDPQKAVEPRPGEDRASAEAARVTDLAGIAPDSVPPGGTAGPADRQLLYGGALGAGLIAVFLFLAGVMLVTAGAGWWSVISFAGAALLGLTSLALAYRLWQRPYEGPPEREP